MNMTSKQLLSVLLRDKTTKRPEGTHVAKQLKVKNLKGLKVRRAPEKSRTAMATVPLPYLRHCARHAYRSPGSTLLKAGRWHYPI